MSDASPTPTLLFHGSKRIELVDWPLGDSPLKENEVAGRTLVSLISPGTELNAAFAAERGSPTLSGYAAVMEIDQAGAAVTTFKPGDRVFLLGPHRARQRQVAEQVIPLPAGVEPAVAVFARLVGVSWTTLTTTRARPADRVIVYGLGIIGNLAAQLFASAGYRVTTIDLDASRCALARSLGLTDVRQSLTATDTDVHGHAALAIDCTGHEQAVVDACHAVRNGGEVVLIGVPWKRRADASAFDLTHVVFHRYVHLRSGWEWELPLQHQDFAAGSIYGNLAAAVNWLAEGRINVAGLATVTSPADATRVYEQLLTQRSPALTAVFNWDAIR